MKILYKILVSIFLYISSTQYIYSVTINCLFSDHMVLQQKIKIPVWGGGRTGEHITVEFNGHVKNTKVIRNKWTVVFEPMNVGGPYKMKISGDSVIEINDIFIGEVWVCSGQSNMGRRMAPHKIVNFEKEKENANHPLIRQFEVAYDRSDTLKEDACGRWKVCSPSTIEDFSAVAYFFARDLQKEIKVPIGLLFSSVGGTEARFWISRRGLSGNSRFKSMVEAYDSALKNHPVKLNRYYLKIDSILSQYKLDSINAVLQHKPKPRKPAPPQNPMERRRVSCYYNAMIAPLTKYPIKGVIWYQGESDIDFALQYQTLFPTLINDWRKNWNIGNFPFLYVQLAPYKKNNPEIREAQLLTLKNAANTAMIVTTDCGDENDVHPPYKQPVGYRLSLAAQALAYHKKIEYSGPIYKSFKVKGSCIELSFSHIGNGLVCEDDKILKGFTISGENKIFLPAKAYIKRNKIVVFNDSIENPIAVRYGWDNVPRVNLYNSDKLPASPFRTDVNNIYRSKLFK